MLKTSHGHLSLRTDMQAAESRISSKTTGVSTLNFVNKILFHKIEAYAAIMKLGGLPNMKKSTNATCILISPVNCMPPLKGWQGFGLKFERGSVATAHPCIFFSRNKPSGSTHCNDLQCSPFPAWILLCSMACPARALQTCAFWSQLILRSKSVNSNAYARGLRRTSPRCRNALRAD